MIDAYYESNVMHDIAGSLINIPVHAPDATNGWSFNVVANTWLGGMWNTNANNGDNVSWGIPLQAGTWTLRVLGIKRSNAGIVRALLNGTQIGSVDWYSAATVLNSLQAYGSTFNIATENLTSTLEFISTTKNSSSTGYGFFAQAISLRRTA